MVHGMYKPYVHGELIAEYRKSITKMAEQKSNNKSPEESQEKSNELVDYVEPGTYYEIVDLLQKELKKERVIFLAGNQDAIDIIPIFVIFRYTVRSTQRRVSRVSLVFLYLAIKNTPVRDDTRYKI